MARKNLYCIVDSETTKKNGLVFDMAYMFVDKAGKIYTKNSFLFKDVLAVEEAWYKEKVSQYWTLTYKRMIKPVTFKVGRKVFNSDVAYFRKEGYKVIFCAYNAPFDIRALGTTSEALTKEKFLTRENIPLHLFDLWHGWISNCPIDYGYVAPWTHEKPGTINPKTGRPFPWNIATNAESVYKYIADLNHFEEKHIAHSDILIEYIILMDILNRKKKMHVVTHPNQMVSMPWKLAQERCREAIEIRKNRQMSFDLINKIPASTPVDRPMTEKPTIVFPAEQMMLEGVN